MSLPLVLRSAVPPLPRAQGAQSLPLTLRQPLQTTRSVASRYPRDLWAPAGGAVLARLPGVKVHLPSLWKL